MERKIFDQERNNPCFKEHQMSMDCLNKNGYVKDNCEVFFTNYNNCKEFWNTVTANRRAKGIYPHMPDFEERVKIKAEHMKAKPPQA